MIFFLLNVWKKWTRKNSSIAYHLPATLPEPLRVPVMIPLPRTGTQAMSGSQAMVQPPGQRFLPHARYIQDQRFPPGEETLYHRIVQDTGAMKRLTTHLKTGK